MICLLWMFAQPENLQLIIFCLLKTNGTKQLFTIGQMVHTINIQQDQI